LLKRAVRLERGFSVARWRRLAGNAAARRNADTGRLFAAATTPDTEVVDPLVLMIAEGRAGWYGQEENRNPYRLLLGVLAYADFVEIVDRSGRYDHAGVAVNRHADVYMSGRKLTEFRGYTQPELFQHDSATMSRFGLRGELTGDGVQVLERAWTTARSILGAKALVVEIIQQASFACGRQGPA
jgi:hypothetical protein